MLDTAMKLLTDLAIKASDPKLVAIENPAEKIYLLGGGQTVEIPVPPPPRKHTVNSLAEIVALAKRFGENDGYSPVVWYDENHVVLVIDDSDHRAETATLALEESEMFAKLVELNVAKKWLSQKDFVRLLRIDLGRTIAPGMLLDIVRTVKFEGSSTTVADVRHTKESLGRDIKAQVSGEREIPEAVTLQVPVYSTMGEKAPHSIHCAVEVESTMPLTPFRLTPMPDEIDRVRQVAVASIAERLLEGLPKSVPCYAGSP